MPKCINNYGLDADSDKLGKLSQDLSMPPLLPTHIFRGHFSYWKPLYKICLIDALDIDGCKTDAFSL